MSMLRNITRGLRSLFRKEQVDKELNEELGSYLRRRNQFDRPNFACVETMREWFLKPT